MVDLIKHFVEPFASAFEQENPSSNRLTWLDSQALERKGAVSSHIINQHNPQTEQDAYVLAAVNEISQKMQLKPAKIIVYDNGKVNAMHLNNDSLAISVQKVEQSTPQHLAATIAHEMGHQQNNEQAIAVSIGRVAVELAAGIAVANQVHQALSKHSSPLTSTICSSVIGGIATIAACALTEPLLSAFRRNQEFAADVNSAAINGATSMIEVLEAKANDTPHTKNWLEQLNSKHPSHAERIVALKQIEQHQQL